MEITQVMFNNNEPIFMQIIEHIKTLAAAGYLKGGDKIPSIRELSKSLQVNPNTVGRAFQEMERQGITVTQRGLGVFIVNDESRLEQLKEELAQSHSETYLDNMIRLGFTKEEIFSKLEVYYAQCIGS